MKLLLFFFGSSQQCLTHWPLTLSKSRWLNTLSTALYEFRVPESIELGSVVGVIRAMDADIGENAEMDYRITGGDGTGMFDITTNRSSQEGVILLRKVRDSAVVFGVVLPVDGREGEGPACVPLFSKHFSSKVLFTHLNHQEKCHICYKNIIILTTFDTSELLQLKASWATWSCLGYACQAAPGVWLVKFMGPGGSSAQEIRHMWFWVNCLTGIWGETYTSIESIQLSIHWGLMCCSVFIWERRRCKETAK